MNPEIVRWAMETGSKVKIIPRFPDECVQEDSSDLCILQELDVKYLDDIKSGKHLMR